MVVVGIIATAIAGLVALTVLAFAVRSIPDWSRYRRLRKM
jgi:hypothetical protein